jgi:hypothetical protein
VRDTQSRQKGHPEQPRVPANACSFMQ